MARRNTVVREREKGTKNYLQREDARWTTSFVPLPKWHVIFGDGGEKERAIHDNLYRWERQRPKIVLCSVLLLSRSLALPFVLFRTSAQAAAIILCVYVRMCVYMQMSGRRFLLHYLHAYTHCVEYKASTSHQHLQTSVYTHPHPQNKHIC